MKKTVSICVGLFLTIACIFYGYTIGRMHGDFSNGNITGTGKIYTVSSFMADMQSEPIRAEHELGAMTCQEGRTLLLYSNILLLFLLLLPVLLFFASFSDALHDEYIGFRKCILFYIHAKDGQK